MATLNQIGSVDALEKASLGASFLCLVHCLALPAVLIAMPSASLLLGAPGSLHGWILAFAIPTSGTALIFGRRAHRSFYPLAAGIVGLAMLAASWLAAHGGADETALTLIGSMIVALAHLANWRLRYRATQGC